jgi:hypothetical protein
MAEIIKAPTTVLEFARAARELAVADAKAAIAAQAAPAAAPVPIVAAAPVPAVAPVAAPAAPVVAEAVTAPAVVVAAPVAAAVEAGKAKPYSFKAMSVDEQGVIIGIGAVAGNIDLDNEVLQKAALVDMAYTFCSNEKRVLKANHSEDLTKAELVASWPGAPILKSGKTLKAGESPTAEDPITGISIAKGSETHWFVAIRPNDPAVIELAKKGGVAGFSWGAYCTKEVK